MTEDVLAYLKKLPRRVKVGAYDWHISIEDGEHPHCGEAAFETQTISLWHQTLTSPNHCVGTLLHECLHIIYETADLQSLKGSKDAKEEIIVTRFEEGIVSLLRDNPKLITWIKQGLK